MRSPRRSVAWVWLVATGILGACNGSDDGRIALRWTGGDTGAATLSAAARRCGNGPLELMGTAGDTGFGLLVDPVAGGLAGTYPVAEGQRAGRGAQVAARWTDSLRVAGYRGRSGAAVLTEKGATISGAVKAEGYDSGAGRRIELQATFRGIPVSPCDTTDPGAP